MKYFLEIRFLDKQQNWQFLTHFVLCYYRNMCSTNFSVSLARYIALGCFTVFHVQSSHKCSVYTQVGLWSFFLSIISFFWCPYQQLREKFSVENALASNFQLQPKYSNILRYLVSKSRLGFETFRRDLAAEQDVPTQDKITWWSMKRAQLCGERELPFLEKSTSSRHITSNQTEAFISQSFHVDSYSRGIPCPWCLGDHLHLYYSPWYVSFFI